MVNNDLPDNHPEYDTQPTLAVLPLGFEAADLDRIARIFQTTPQKRQYLLIGSTSTEKPDILLVNYDNPAALTDQDAILESTPKIPVVAASRGPLREPMEYHIRGMLMAARVLGVLDKIPGCQAVSPHLPAPSANQDHRDDPVESERPHEETVKPQAMSEAPEASPPGFSKATGTYRALVVDDSIAMQKSLELNLMTLDQIAAIDFADDGETALEKADAIHYDLVFLDIMMPGIDGYETCSRLRKKPGYKKTPVIMVSGKTSPLDEVKGVMAGCTTYVTKPIQKEEFQKLAGRILAWLANYANR